MSEGQKIIKYFAIAFAIFLSVNIIGGIITAIFFGLSIFGITLGIQEVEDKVIVTKQEIDFSQSYEEIENIKIEIGYSKLTIEEGTELKVEASKENSTLEVKKVGNTLRIKDNKVWTMFNQYEESEIRITVPENAIFEKVTIEAGSGEVEVSNLQTKNLDFDVGAGNVMISNIIVEKKTEIDGGAGKVVIQDSSLNNLDLDVGVGEFQIKNTYLLGNTDIDAGIGKLEVNLKGNLEDYKITPQRGLGSFIIEGKEIEDKATYGEGENKIRIDAGVGKVEISFNK